MARLGRRRPRLRPLVLAAPVLVLLICLPLLRPLRFAQPAPDEAVRLATVQSLLDRHGLELDPKVIGNLAQTSRVVRIGDRLYANQPPTLAVLLAGPAWVLRRRGLDLRADPEVPAYVLTVLGVTLPVALAAGLLYRMARLFELNRRWRLLLAVTCVAGSGLLSYATVLNAQAPAAAALIAAAACLVHVENYRRPRRAAGWIWLMGFCAALSVALEPLCILIAAPFALVIAVTRFSWRFRLGGVLLMILGALPVFALHAAFNVRVTGDLVPVELHPSLHQILARIAPSRSSATQGDDDSDDVPARAGGWTTFIDTCDWLTTALVGTHGLLSHFPILLLGVGGVGAVMHRHWPAPIKWMAGIALFAFVAALCAFCWERKDFHSADFAIRWMVPLLPLLLFWVGAWMRRSHGRGIWTAAAVLMGWSVAVGLVGATNPIPMEGFQGYTAGEAMMRLVAPGQAVGHGAGDGIASR